MEKLTAGSTVDGGRPTDRAVEREVGLAPVSADGRLPSGSQEYARLLPPEAFSDEGPVRGDFARLRPRIDPRERRERSATVRARISGSCAGWRERPTSREFYAAVRAAEPDDRQKGLLAMWATETHWRELMQAWAEEAYTLRELVAALHRAGLARCRCAGVLNRWAAHPGRREA